MIELMAEFQLHTLQSTGRWGGQRDEQNSYFLDKTKGILKEAGFGDKEIKEIQAKFWDTYVKYDYAYHILGGSYVPKSDDKALYEKWQSMRELDNTPTADDLRKFINEIGDTNELRSEFVNAYAYYEKYQHHLDASLWAKRRKIPQLLGTLGGDG